MLQVEERERRKKERKRKREGRKEGKNGERKEENQLGEEALEILHFNPRLVSLPRGLGKF